MVKKRVKTKKMKTIIYDIETVARPMEDLPETVQEYMTTRFERQRKHDSIEKFMCLDSDFGRIIAISWQCLEEGSVVTDICKDEKASLENFWSQMRELKPSLFVGFNSKSFDAPFLHKRSAYLGAKPPIHITSKRYSIFPHFDIAEVLSGFDQYRMKSLSTYCALFGIEHDTESGENVKEWYEEGDMERIAEHSRKDVEATALLYKRIKDFYLLK